MQIDKARYKRQEQGANAWKNNGGVGTLEHPTGMGKTFTALQIIMRQMVVKDPSRTFLVVVPRIELKTQWEDEIKDLELHKNVEVMVINTLIKLENYEIFMLVLDEIHRYASTEFSKLFNIVSYKHILGLTASMERLDQKHQMLEYHCPIVDTITPEEARQNGWIALYEEYALGIQMTPTEEAEYNKVNQTFFYYFSRFNQDFDLAMKSAVDNNVCYKYAEKNGWNVNLGKTHPWSPENVRLKAINFMRAMNKRKQFLYNLDQKKSLVVEFRNKRKQTKTIVFSESSSFVDSVSALHPKILPFHSVMKYKEIKVKEIKKGQIVEKTKRLSPKAQRDKNMAIFKTTPSYTLAAAKALDEGLNIPDIELALVTSYTSNPTQKLQRRGRAARKFTFSDGSDKVPKIVYFYTIGTQEEKWLKKSLKSFSNIQFVTTVDEVFQRRKITLSRQNTV